MKLTVDMTGRYAKMRAHTATHLLHFMLHTLLGGTKQAGSLVDDDYLRFDFAAKQPLSNEQIEDINTTINTYITHALPVITQELSYDDAIKTGAKAFFEDKYGDTVRVVSIISDTSVGTSACDVHNCTSLTSIELCGGTHVTNTKDIGAFHIVAQESVASGIRRIIAVTGPKVAEHIQKLETYNLQLATKLACQPKQLEEKIEKLLKSYEHMKSDHESLQGKIITTHLDTIISSVPPLLANECEGLGEGWGEGAIINTSGTDLEHHNFKDVVNHAKSRRSDRNWILYTNEGNFAIHIGTGSMSAKAFAKQHGLKGGGSDQFVQGRDEKIKEIV